MDFLIISLTIICGAFGIYLFSTRNHNHFKKLGIPHIKPIPIFGNIAKSMLKIKAFPYIIEDVYSLYPDAKYVGVYEFSSPIIVLKDPELLKSVMIKNFDSFTDHKFFTETTSEPLFNKNLIALKGDAWRDMRSLLSPAFTSSKMKMMFQILSKCSMDFTDHLAKLNPQPEGLDMKDVFGRYALDVIASAAFGIGVDSMKHPDNMFYRMGKEVADFSKLPIVKLMMKSIFPWLSGFLNIKLVETETADFFTNVIEKTIAKRDAEGIVRPDMIHLMMQARDRSDRSTLSLEDMTAQAFIFVIGGFESPSTTLSFAAYALALNQEVQRKLQAEIDQVVETSSGEVSYEDLHAMKYLDAVVNEVLRIFPPSAIMDRVATKSFTLPPALPGLEPLKIEPGQGIWIPCYNIHHDPRYFPNPEEFDPERFNEANKSKISPLTYFPFGLGPRVCIANRFALMEVKLALFYLLAKCNLLPTPKIKFPVKLTPKSFMMKPEGGFCVQIEPRK